MDNNHLVNKDKPWESVKNKINAWKKFLRKERKKKNIERMEKLSESNMSYDQINISLENKEMWKRFDSTIKALKRKDRFPQICHGQHNALHKIQKHAEARGCV